MMHYFWTIQQCSIAFNSDINDFDMAMHRGHNLTGCFFFSHSPQCSLTLIEFKLTRSYQPEIVYNESEIIIEPIVLRKKATGFCSF